MESEFQTGSAVADKSFEFAVRIVNLCKYLRYKKKEFVLSKQLLRSGTSIGANVHEGRRAQSRADFLAKMSIALKEANETYYWLKLLYKTDYIPDRNENVFKEKYTKQLELYKLAIEGVIKKKVENVYIYSTYLEKTVKIL